MRDGIFKSLDMGRRWKSLMRCCERKADWGTRVQQKATDALMGDMRSEISPRMLNALRAHAAQAQTMIPGFGMNLPDWGDATRLSALERSICSEVTRCAECGMSGSEAVKTGVGAAFADRADSRMRQVDQQIPSDSRQEARPLMAEARRGLEAAIPAAVVELFAPSPRPRPAPRSTRFNLDENLAVAG